MPHVAGPSGSPSGCPRPIIVEGYGMTEATMGLTLGATARSAHRRVGTVGDSRCRTPRSASGRPRTTPVAAGEAGRGLGARPPGDGRATSAGPSPTPPRPSSTAGCGPATSASWAGTASSRSSTGPRTCCSTRATTCTRASSRSCSPRDRRSSLGGRRRASPTETVGEEPVAVARPRWTGPSRPPRPSGPRLAAALDEQVAPYKRLRAVHVTDSAARLGGREGAQARPARRPDRGSPMRSAHRSGPGRASGPG